MSVCTYWLGGDLEFLIRSPDEPLECQQHRDTDQATRSHWRIFERWLIIRKHQEGHVLQKNPAKR